jgi:hypothetical protein
VGNVLQILLRLPNYITTTTTAANAVECRWWWKWTKADDGQ